MTYNTISGLYLCLQDPQIVRLSDSLLISLQLLADWGLLYSTVHPEAKLMPPWDIIPVFLLPCMSFLSKYTWLGTSLCLRSHTSLERPSLPYSFINLLASVSDYWLQAQWKWGSLTTSQNVTFVTVNGQIQGSIVKLWDKIRYEKHSTALFLFPERISKYYFWRCTQWGQVCLRQSQCDCFPHEVKWP